MIVRDLGLEVREISPRRFRHARGHVSEVYSVDASRTLGIDLIFIQDNRSFSQQSGVLHGLHYQLPPYAQDKLVRVARGASSTSPWTSAAVRQVSENWVGLELSDELGNQILIPKGFAHGFVTLEPDTQVVYKVTALYAPTSDRSIRVDDPAIASIGRCARRTCFSLTKTARRRRSLDRSLSNDHRRDAHKRRSIAPARPTTARHDPQTVANANQFSGDWWRRFHRIGSVPPSGQPMSSTSTS
jgi:dTDP-4-dehydrorhamnose 3,5-epimerase